MPLIKTNHQPFLGFSSKAKATPANESNRKYIAKIIPNAAIPGSGFIAINAPVIKNIKAFSQPSQSFLFVLYV